MSYEQAMNHSRNHRKDRFIQQCSGYGGDGISHQMSEAQIERNKVNSFIELLENLKGSPDFPVYISNSGSYGIFRIVSEKYLFGYKIESYAELVDFGEKYVLGKEKLEAIVNEIKKKERLRNSKKPGSAMNRKTTALIRLASIVPRGKIFRFPWKMRKTSENSQVKSMIIGTAMTRQKRHIYGLTVQGTEETEHRMKWAMFTTICWLANSISTMYMIFWRRNIKNGIEHRSFCNR